MEKRSRFIGVRLTETEFEQLQEKASMSKLGYGEYVRTLIKENVNNKAAHPIYKKDKGKERDRDCHFKITEAEEKRIKELSRISGLSASSILRMMIDKTNPPKLLSADDRQLIIQLKRIGNNFNQIAAVANATKTIDELYLRENIADLEDVLYQIRLLYGV